MAAVTGSLSFPALRSAAPELEIYDQFRSCEVPGESEASRTYLGFIRPFSEDAVAIRVARALDWDFPVQVDAGRLDVPESGAPPLPFEKLLTKMALPFSVLALEFSDTRRPRTYLVDPPMVPRVSDCEHLRLDKCITVNGAVLPALCVYSGSLLEFTDNRTHVEQVLDQTAIYLAKYLVWLRTRRLYRRTATRIELVRERRPSEQAFAAAIERANDLFWRGYWPGRCAPSSPAGHLATIKPENECWCWSGKNYGECCRNEDLKRERAVRAAPFVNRLMAAVRSRI